jgi:tetratricopeptide (TPR) repeat protein
MNARILLILVLAIMVAGCVTTGSGDSSDFVRAADRAPPKVDPKASASYEMALVSMRAGNTSKSEKQFKKLSNDYPEFSGPHNNLGIIHYREGNIKEAQSAFEEALKINPDSVVSLNYLGIISRGKGEFKQAQVFYEKALRADPNYAYAHLNYGILLELYMGKLSDALMHYKRYQELTEEEDKKVNGWIVELGRRVKN